MSVTFSYPSEGIEESFVEVVGDPAAILHLSQHVAHGVPGHALLQVHVVKMVLHKLHTGGEVSLVELVRDVPAQGTVLTTLL